MHGDIWSISSADLRVGVVARGEAIVDAARSPAVKALWQTFSAARGGRPPSPRDYRASLPVGHGDFVVVAAETGDDRDPPDLEYVHYGHGIRRMTGLDLDGVRLSEMPATFRLTVVPLYFEVLRTGMPVFCVTHSSDAFVRSWQRAAFPCRVGDLPGLFVWLIPLEYRLTALNTFMNGSTEGMAAWRPMRDDGGAVEDFVCLYANDALCRAAEVGPGMLTGRLLFRDYPHVVGSPLDAALRRVVAMPDGDGETVEFDHHATTGVRRFRVALTANAGAALLVASDVTEVHARERRVAEAERSLFMVTRALDATDVNVAIADARLPDCPLVFVNEAFCRTTGYAREDVLGRNCRFLQGAETEPDAIAMIRACLRDGTTYSGLLTNYRRDGSRFLNRLHIAPVHGPDGDLVAYVAVQRDVTREEEEREAASHRQRMEALGRLAGGIAHEINNLLQPMVTLPASVADALPADASEAREDLRIIEDAARTARDILRGFLSFARGDAGRVERVDCLETVLGALDLVEALQPPGVRIVRAGLLESGRPCGAVMCARGQMMQVLANLVGNAAHALGGRGDIEVGLWADAEDGDGVVVRVSDRGCGMDEETRRRIFDPFFTTKGIGEGTGLGLSVVYGLVQSWGGRIDVESEPGEGTTVAVRLPRADR